MNKTWVGSPADVRTGDAAEQAINTINDNKFYTDPHTGIIKVDEARWKQAQQFEEAGWTIYWSHSSSDRNHEHYGLFDEYKSLPQNLGKVLEIGCGPFTQASTILATRKADSITLTDPLLDKYLNLEHCPYKTGSLHNLKTTCITIKAEDINYNEEFDTVICINVLEHVMDAMKCLTNIYNSLKNGGILIMGERAHDEFNPFKSYDVGHPITIKTPIFDEFRSKFNIIYKNGNYFIGVK